MFLNFLYLINMDNKLLHSIISSGYIRGICDTAVLYYEGRTLHCDFVGNHNDFSGRVECEKYNNGDNFIGEGVIGLPSMDSFLKILKTLGDDINAHVVTESRSEKFLVMGDGVMQMRYGLVHKSQIPKIPRINPNTLPSDPIDLYIDADFIKRFYKLSGAIKDCKYVFINKSGNELDLILSQTESYDTGAKLRHTVEGGRDVMGVRFSVKTFRGVLNNNKKMDGGRMRFHVDDQNDGVAVFQFFSDEMKCTYNILSE
jgi:hypothetical protein